MANETVTKSGRFYCVSLVPDICKTPIGPATPPIPYSVVGEFADATGASPNLKSHSEPLILHGRSVIPTVKGDEPGTAGGIKSGTTGKKVETKTFSTTYRANGTNTVQVGREVWMNDRNTVGKIYERGGETPRTRLQQISAMLEQQVAEATDGIRSGLKSAAQNYKDNASGSLHRFGGDAMDAGGKIMMGSAALGGAGVVIAATGVGAPVAAAMEVGAAAGGTVGGVVASVGGVAETTASVLDKGADFILTGKMPDLLGMVKDAAATALEAAVLGKYRAVIQQIEKRFPALKRLTDARSLQGKKPSGTKPPPPPPSGKDGGKTRRKKEEKSEPPSNCCPKNAAPGGKPVTSRKPVHFGTGEEVLYQTDFVLDGPEPFSWTRCYRSSAATQDWGVLGARWSTQWTRSLSVCAAGLVYHDDDGRALRLPALAVGQSHDSRKEGCTLRRPSAQVFELLWRDGTLDTFDAVGTGWLPHGYDGVNAMRPASAPLAVQRYQLARSAGRDGRGTGIEWLPDAAPGAVLLRIRVDGGHVVEAMRDAGPGAASSPRIGQVDEVRADGSRICHVRYRYDVEAVDSALPRRHNLVEQTNIARQSRGYAYHHHLLTGHIDYLGLTQRLRWISQQALFERWNGSTLDDAALLAQWPITLDNSYRARATSSIASDNLGATHIAYLGADTTRVTEPDGGVLDYTFDANWLATDVRRVAPDGTSSVSLGRREWDRDGMLLAEIDGAGRAGRYAYDAQGNLVCITDAGGFVTSIAYDTANQPVAVTDAMGHVTRRTFDDAGRLLSVADALGHVTGYRYDEQGRLADVTDARGGTQSFRYDSQGQLNRQYDCSGYPTAYEYDHANRLIAVTDALGQQTCYARDVLGRVTGVTHPDGASETFDYDAGGNLLCHTDAMGFKTRYRYNAYGLPIERIDALGYTVGYRYDAALRLVELINQNGESYGLAYDAEGRLAAETGFDGKVTAYAYDGAGNLVSSTCGTKHTDLYRDRRGLLIARSTDDGATRYVHDALGRLTAVTTPHAEQSFTHDALGRLIGERSATFLNPPPILPWDSETAPRQPDAEFVISHAYDELGSRIQTTLPDGSRIDTLRYGSGHWHGTLWRGQTIAAIERDRLHRETRRQLGEGGLVATRRYDARSRLASMTLSHHRNSAGQDTDPAIRTRQFHYDPVGNLTTIEHGSRDTAGNIGAYRYGYDPLGQLLSSVQRDVSEVFAFDPAGNLIDVPKVDAHGKPVDFVAAPVRHNLLMEYQGHHYRYDEQGNVISRRFDGRGSIYAASDMSLEYDADNRLIGAVMTRFATRHTARYFYDAFGRRIAKQVREESWRDSHERDRQRPEKVDDSTTLFVWEGDVMVQELCGGESVTYVYEPDSFVPLAHIEEIDILTLDGSNHQKVKTIYDPSTTRFYFYQCDHLGTPQELVSKEGNVGWSRKSKAWGQKINDEGVLNQFLGFQGQYFDFETGLYYNRYRYYDYSNARYITSDPIGLLGGLNSYQYVPNPIAWLDPLGLNSSSCSKVCCAVVIGETQKRVDDYTKVMEGPALVDGFKLMTINTFPKFKWAKNAWYRGGPNTDAEWKASLAENEKFINIAKKENCKIVDIGRDPGKVASKSPISKYYELELNMTQGYHNIVRVKSSFVLKIIG